MSKKQRISTDTFASLTVSDIDKIYFGKGDNCRCGCAGEYTERDELTASRLKRAQKAFADGAQFEIADDGMYIDVCMLGDMEGEYKSITVYAW